MPNDILHCRLIMATYNVTSCVPCSFRETNISAVLWCVTCSEGLCKGCSIHHEKSKLLKNHLLVLLEKHKDNHVILSNVSENCNFHNKPYNKFCSDHQAICCEKCEHEQCLRLVPLEAVTASVRSSAALTTIEEGLNDVLSKIDTMKEKKLQSIPLLKDQVKSIEENVLQLQSQIKDELSETVSHFFKEIDQTKNDYVAKTTSLLKTLESKRETILQTIYAMSQMKEWSSNLKFFIALKRLESKLREEELELTSLIESADFDDLELKFKSKPKYADVFAEFGGISRSHKTVNIPTKTSGQTAVLLPEGWVDVTSTIVTFGDMKLEKQTEFSFLESCKITGSVVLPNKCMLFCDFDKNRMLLFDRHGQFLRQIDTEAPPRDLAVYDQSSVALTLTKAKKIVRIEILSNTDKVVQEIYVMDECIGIDVNKRQFIVAVKKFGIQIIDSNGCVTRTLPLACVSLCCTEDKIIYLNERSDIVRCCDFHGEQLWEKQLSLETSLYYSKLHSITSIDNQGNILVCDSYKSDVSLVTSDGKRVEKVLKSDDGLWYPGGLHYDKSVGLLLLATHCNNRAVLYQVKS